MLQWVAMPFVDARSLPVVDRLPGWHGRFFHSEHMTFGHYEFEPGAQIHEHAHEQEEVWHVLEGELEVTIGDETQRAVAGCVAIIPKQTTHAVRAVTAGKAIVVDHPVREGFERHA